MSVLRHLTLAVAVAAATTVWSGCGGGGVPTGGGRSCCFIDCPDGGTVGDGSWGGEGVTQADCDEAAQDPEECGGVLPTNHAFMAGCICPGGDEPGECVAPDWYN